MRACRTIRYYRGIVVSKSGKRVSDMRRVKDAHAGQHRDMAVAAVRRIRIETITHPQHRRVREVVAVHDISVAGPEGVAYPIEDRFLSADRRGRGARLGCVE